MAIWRKKQRKTPECSSEETKGRTYCSKTNSWLTYSPKVEENESKKKVEEVSPKKSAIIIPDLNETIGSEVVAALPTKRSSSVMVEVANYYQTNNDIQNLRRYQASLILRGCKACHIYVMVSEIDERCPKCCVGTFLCDVSHPNKQRRLV